MAKASQGLSAKDFKDPLLRVLGHKTKFDSGRTVDHEEVYDPICTLMGITRDQFGMDTTDTEWVVKWTQWAFQALRDEGLGDKRGRGKWGLTVQGVDKARMMNNTNNTNNTAATNPTVDMDVDAVAKAILADVVPANDDGMYHPDPYIRELALEDHPCIGFFSNQSPLCPTCPARTVCQTRLLDRLAVVAAGLAREDHAALQVHKDLTQQSQVDDLINAVLPLDKKFKLPKGASATMQTCQADATCGHCRGTIKVGDNAVWVRNITDTSTGNKKSMMIHDGCYEP